MTIKEIGMKIKRLLIGALALCGVLALGSATARLPPSGNV